MTEAVKCHPKSLIPIAKPTYVDSTILWLTHLAQRVAQNPPIQCGGLVSKVHFKTPSFPCHRPVVPTPLECEGTSPWPKPWCSKLGCLQASASLSELAPFMSWWCVLSSCSTEFCCRAEPSSFCPWR